MPFCRTLNAKELQQLDDWMIHKQIKLDNRTRRDLSDVVTVARLFRKLNAKLVDMYNFSSHSSLALKLENWKMFNLKVLRKLGFKLSRNDLEQLASARRTAAESLLYHLMCTERDGLKLKFQPQILPLMTVATQEDIQRVRNSLAANTSDQMPVQLLENDKGPAEDPKNVPYTVYKQLIQEKHKKQKYISSVRHKVKLLQSLILVKEERINNLMKRLATLSKQTSL
ncbi:sperm flagellar protein 1 [Drosophila virilis]|uniref:CH-like domain-containing protein n=1 Tax=Drosophila virilis TaxID=7244 RepID=B4MF30_DROVI|nr:sperm flagellar protein 1 [Drosophila virilis]ACY70514.1 hypothetical protein DVIR88_6g0051 [Drosophila virilis]EDW71131.1 uncharacterized protein Dvir_GJ19072 [Drosophila virilis]